MELEDAADDFSDLGYLLLAAIALGAVAQVYYGIFEALKEIL